MRKLREETVPYNTGWAAELKKGQVLRIAGLSIVDFVAFDDWLDTKHRTVITIDGDELVRGGGGPRCLTLPLRRAPL